MSALDALGFGRLDATRSGFSAMSSEDFTKIIFAELAKQDPLAPNDTNALIQQISNIRSIQSDMDLSARLQSLVDQNEFASAATLIGKHVSGLTDDFERAEGRVRSIAKSLGITSVELESGERLSVSNIDTIQGAEAGS